MIWNRNKIRTPIMLQLGATDCGAVALNIILRYYNINTSIEQLRSQLGVCRDGCKVTKIIEVGRLYDCDTEVKMLGIQKLIKLRQPCILYWNYNHFVVYEYATSKAVYINDPATGRRRITYKQLGDNFTGLTFIIHPKAEVKRKKERFNFLRSVYKKCKKYRVELIRLMITALSMFIITFLYPLLSKYFFDKLFGTKNEGGYFFAFFFLAILFQFALAIFQEILLAKIQKKISFDSTGELILHLLHLDMNFFSQRYASDLAGRFEINSKLCNFIVSEIPSLIIGVIAIVGNIGAAFYLNFVVAILECLIAFLFIAIIYHYSEHLFSSSMKVQTAHSRMVGSAFSGVNVIDTIKATDIKEQYVRRIIGYYANYIENKQKNEMVQKILMALPSFLTNFNKVLVIMVGGYLVIKQEMSVGALIALNIIAGNIIKQFTMIIEFAKKIQFNKVHLYRTNDIMNTPQEEDRSYLPNRNVDGDIQIRQVTFGYNTSEKPIFQQINCTIHKGECTVIVGGVGSGKSTLIKLIVGLYQPWEGTISFGEAQRNQINDEDFAKYMGYVGQRSLIFGGTVRDNITLWDNQYSDEELIQVCEEVGLKKVIDEYGLDYTLAENGENISGGEIERICIARVLLRNPKVIIFDESMRALDPINEKKILKMIKRKQITVVIISHRMSTLNNADKVILLNNGDVKCYEKYDEMSGELDLHHILQYE